jgi:hypothetical protein
MLQHPILLGLGALLLIVLFFFLRSRYKSHWKPWIGLGWILSYDRLSQEVTIVTFLLNSPPAKAGVVRGSIMLERNGEKLPSFANKQAFMDWIKSHRPACGKTVTFRLLEPAINNGLVEREVTLTYQRMYGGIPHYPRRFFTAEEKRRHWRESVGEFNNYYLRHTCPRTGVTYEKRRTVPIDF